MAPVFAGLSAGGVWSVTVPAVASEDSAVVVSTSKPMSFSRSVACSSVSPSTLGTV